MTSAGEPNAIPLVLPFSSRMEQTPPAIDYASRHAGSPRSAALVSAAILCFVASPVPLVWLALQLVNIHQRQWRAGLMETRVPFGLVLLEEAAVVLALVGLLISAGVLLCVRARWAVHVAAAVIGVVLVGATGATIAEAVRRFSDHSPMPKPISDHVAELGLRAFAGVVWPLTIAVLLSRRSVRAAIVARRGSMPGTPVLLFATGAVLIWCGLAATSLNAQAAPVGIYFGRFYDDKAVTLWRIAFAAAWLLAGVLLLRASMIGWVLALLVTLAALASEALLAGIGGSDALTREALSSGTPDAWRDRMATASEPNAPWPAALFRSATLVSLLGLLLVAAQHFLFEDVPRPPAEDGPRGGTGPHP